MKKTRQSLRLSRETLSHLTREQLAHAPGAIFPPLDPNWTKYGTYCFQLSEAACQG